MKWLQSPLLHFLLIGAAIYIAYGLIGTRAVPELRAFESHGTTR